MQYHTVILIDKVYTCVCSFYKMLRIVCVEFYVELVLLMKVIALSLYIYIYICINRGPFCKRRVEVGYWVTV